MKCPKCNNPISPFKVWLISRWSFVKCNKCGTRSGRDVNLQLFIIAALLIFPIVFQFSVFNPLFLIWAGIVMFIDAYTIKLVSKEKENIDK
jgi:hypothetical protein